MRQIVINLLKIILKWQMDSHNYASELSGILEIELVRFIFIYNIWLLYGSAYSSDECIDYAFNWHGFISYPIEQCHHFNQFNHCEVIHPITLLIGFFKCLWPKPNLKIQLRRIQNIFWKEKIIIRFFEPNKTFHQIQFIRIHTYRNPLELFRTIFFWFFTQKICILNW